jgi:hypothetical protein
MGLSIAVAFLTLILCAVIAVLVMRKRAATRQREEYGLKTIHSNKGLVDPTQREPKHRTWYGRKIVAQVPLNGVV